MWPDHFIRFLWSIVQIAAPQQAPGFRGTGAQATLGFEIAVARSRVAVGERPIFQMKVVNQTKSLLWMKAAPAISARRAPYGEVWLEVLDPDKNLLQYECTDAQVASPTTSDYVVLEPGGAWTWIQEPLCYDFRKPGRYSVTAHYQTKPPDTLLPPKRTIPIKRELVSQTVVVEVAPKEP